MHERVAAETQESPEPMAVPALRQGPVVERVLALQRSAGNAAVTRLIARKDDEIKWDPSLLPAPSAPMDWRPTSFVFILGAKDNEALSTAREHYRSPLMTSPFRKVIDREDMSDPTLAGIFDYDKALHDGVLKPLNDGQITDKTRIRLQACFTGYGPRMVNLLDRAFGDGAGVVIAPTVEVAYANDIWHSEGISGWWVTSDRSLTTDELAFALKAKYGKSVKLDLTTYQEDTGTHHKGEPMKDDDEMWAEIARKAKETPGTDSSGTTWWVYVANPFVQSVKPGYEDDPLLYTKSVYYSPTEL